MNLLMMRELLVWCGGLLDVVWLAVPIQNDQFIKNCLPLLLLLFSQIKTLVVWWKQTHSSNCHKSKIFKRTFVSSSALHQVFGNQVLARSIDAQVLVASSSCYLASSCKHKSGQVLTRFDTKHCAFLPASSSCHLCHTGFTNITHGNCLTTTPSY
jgi:hypothetical protein